MSLTRRTFLGGGMGGIAGTASSAENPAGDRNMKTPVNLQPLDYGLSFICASGGFNELRLWIESRTLVFDDRHQTVTEFFQCGSCKSEDTFAERDLFKEDNYDFLPILGDREWLIFRRHARLSESYRQVQQLDEIWGQPVLKLSRAKDPAPIASWEEIQDATVRGLPLIGQTEIENAETELRAMMEYPIKTINITSEGRRYQVDTGPLAFPDLSKRRDRSIDALSLGFVAFNTTTFADFVTEQPTPVIEDGVEACRIHHYSNPFSLPAKNCLLAAALPN